MPLARERLVPFIVAVALFMENLDSTVISTALPAIAKSIGTSPIELKLAITSYLLALAIFIPMSGWMADRFGARTIFRSAIVVFVAGSIACAMSSALWHFVLARFVQGMGGAMMSPVGRLVLFRTVEKTKLVAAMALVTMPALIGPMLGPPLGGFITTYASWHWIFLVNVPIGLIGFLLVTAVVENVKAEVPDPFDTLGMILVAFGIGGLAFGSAVITVDFVPKWIAGVLLGTGVLGSAAYVVYARKMPAPVLDLSLLALPTFRAGVIGGFVFRVGAGALPFLLPLLLQLGFGMTPFQSGLVTFATAIGALAMKTLVPPILRRFGFRDTMIVNAVVAGLTLAACAAFVPGTPVWVMFCVLLLGGLARSLQFTSLNTLAFAEVDPRRMSRATSLASVTQQLSISTGVTIGALVLETVLTLHGGTTLGAADFPPAFLLIGAISVSSVVFFVKMPANAGEELIERAAKRE
ncbi:MFS permease [Rhodovulum sp. PH10]|uniref:DHA2 family efflux MFS transporter permease subunit n=1 Tax=Rhodovulum sp. PH10 TaxID=1187851 RepID=UPI00027C2D36|nr:DHA2 family efflux MFS transporter permease subunit [Rhodovulum sp. PH10]EJW10491.1 MFS permease [Rhodovulum sp. PH10]